jgi:nitroreductase
MAFLDLAKTRCSVRKYTGQPVEEETLRTVLKAGRVAPTGCNNQPQRIIVVRSPEGKAKLAKAANTFDAPVVLIVCVDRSQTWTRAYDGKVISDIDASIVTDHMMLQATELGLGSCWVCWFQPQVIREEFQLPDQWEPVNLLTLGYPAGPTASPERHAGLRKPLEETVFWETV